MKKTDIKQIYCDLKDLSGKAIKVGGWVRSARDMGSFAFVDLNDGTSFKGAQIIVGKEVEGFDTIAKLNAGSSIMVEGEVKATPENKQPFDIVAKNVEVISATGADYPLQKKGHSLEFLREQAYLRPRTNMFNAVFRVRSEIAYALHTFFKN